MNAAQHVRLYNILIGSMKTQAIHVAAELGLADVLAAGQRDIDELARETHADRAALFRLMRALCSLGLFSERDGKYSISLLGESLRRDVPGSLRPFALLLGGDAWWRAWGALGQSVRTGQAAFDATHGRGYFEYLAGDADERKRFHEFLASVAAMNAAAIIEAYSFAACRRIVDVGGGEGNLLSHILATVPAARGVLLDLPGTVPRPEALPAAVRDRFELIAGDFFQSVPSGGDCYLLQQVLHDWSDDKALAILARCREAMSSGARLLIVDAVIEPGNQPSFNKFTDLHMMVLSNGGRERTLPEFQQLLTRAGLNFERVIPTSTAFSILESRR